jgi:cytochrome bd-type quinol oxidase subunit 2
MDPDKSITERPRPFLTRADVATLIGMMLCVASLFLTWKREPLDPKTLQSLPTTLIVNPLPDFAVTGFGLPLHWPLTFCAVLCGASLLVAPKPQNRSRWAAVQITAAAVCLLLPLVRFALYPGVLTALAGGGLLLMGALERFGIGGGKAGGKEET